MLLGATADQETLKIALKELRTANLETLLDNFGSILVHAVLICAVKNHLDGAAAISLSAVLADVLNAPIAKLAAGDEVEVGKDFIDARTLVDIGAVLEDVLNNKAASLTNSDLLPVAK